MLPVSHSGLRDITYGIEVDHGPPVTMLVRGRLQEALVGCDSVNAVGAPCTAGMVPSLPAW